MSNTAKPKKEFKKVIVEGIAMYAHVHTPAKSLDPKDPPQFRLDLIVDDENAKKLLDEGLKVSKVQIDEDTKAPKIYPDFPNNKVFTLRRKTQRKDALGNVIVLEPLKVVDSQGNTIPPTMLVGNGSKVRCSVNPFEYNFQGKSGVGHSLLGVQVLALVAYVNTRDDGLDKVDNAFTVPTAPEKALKATDEDPFADAE